MAYKKTSLVAEKGGIVLEISISEAAENEVEARRLAQATSVSLEARRIVLDGKDWDVRYEWYIDREERDRYRFRARWGNDGYIDLAWSVTDAYDYLSAAVGEVVDLIPMEIVPAHSGR